MVNYMSDLIRILVHIVSFIMAAFVLVHVDFIKFMRKGHESKAQMLYIIVALALGYLMAQFILNLSINYIY